MANKRDSFYFDSFIECTEASCTAARLLRETLVDFDPDKLQERLALMHEVEHTADEKKHHVMDMLVKEFIAPIEREDIATLCSNIDDMTDKLEDVIIRLYINNVQTVEAGAIKMMDVIIACCEEVSSLMKEFADFRHSKQIRQRIIRINELEEQADRMYIENMRNLHIESKDPLHIIAWREIYNYLEKCADSCEHVGDIVESVVMKNS